MDRINYIQETVGLLDNHIAPPDEHKFRMRHRVLLPVGCANDEWPGASEVMSNELVIHELLFSIEPSEVNRISRSRHFTAR